jgi:hypothetical protein
VSITKGSIARLISIREPFSARSLNQETDARIRTKAEKGMDEPGGVSQERCYSLLARNDSTHSLGSSWFMEPCLLASVSAAAAESSID